MAPCGYPFRKLMVRRTNCLCSIKDAEFKDFLLPLPDVSRTASTSARTGQCVLGRQRAPRTLGTQNWSIKYWTCRDQSSRTPAWKQAAPNIPTFLGRPIRYIRTRKDTVVVTGQLGLDADLRSKKETFSIFRMAYPMPFYTRAWMAGLTTPRRLEGSRYLGDL